MSISITCILIAFVPPPSPPILVLKRTPVTCLGGFWWLLLVILEHFAFWVGCCQGWNDVFHMSREGVTVKHYCCRVSIQTRDLCASSATLIICMGEKWGWAFKAIVKCYHNTSTLAIRYFIRFFYGFQTKLLRLLRDWPIIRYLWSGCRCRFGAY